MTSGWSLWERYFVRVYGPNWRNTRNGRTGFCRYCSGEITTELSRKLSAQAKQHDTASCKRESEQ